ncbi:MAG TPA: hypothetical protein PLP21_03170 [Pyrinomonadaceae bacterium]|nr:hypothetical protein [Pyrinomonadaceae bacterium]
MPAKKHFVGFENRLTLRAPNSDWSGEHPCLPRCGLRSVMRVIVLDLV